MQQTDNGINVIDLANERWMTTGGCLGLDLRPDLPPSCAQT